ncbi:endonuclease/exonuclease/phosphatase family protein [Vibrio sp. ER1A]|uniref:endonuclease/exonuclease/phosphatase family protein n=1 Tax=Vibrio sp. ER1A TaxID=1517681 RepID=UPI00068D1F96|nr:endonuclease/exonuclease/phosphatase family protein [Vibrio sp. ER1A]
MASTMKRTLSYYKWLFSLVMGISLFPTFVSATTLTTWNIEWLTLNPSSKFEASQRDKNDFLALARQFEALSPSVLAFQEVDSQEAIRKIVGNDYDIYLSDRALPSNKQHQFSAINQYTGFAVKKGLSIKDAADFPLSTGSKLRFASAIKLNVDNKTINLLSVHLKAGCSGKFVNQNSCHTLKKQGKVINSWLKHVEQQNELYIVLGDFNHNLAYNGDWLWKIITNDLDTAPRLTSQQTKAACKVKSRKNNSKTHQFRSLIDHIIVSPELRTTPAVQSLMPIEDVLKYQMSDHCPLSIELYD